MFWYYGGTNAFYIGKNNSYVSHFTQANFGGGGAGPDTMSYGFGYWMVTRFSAFKLIAPDGSGVIASGTPSCIPQHLRAGTTGITFHRTNGTYGFQKGTDNLASIAVVSTTPTMIVDGTPIGHACDPTGSYLMGPTLTSSSRRSADGGATWVASTLSAGSWHFAYGGGVGVNSRWIAISGSQVFYSANFGDTWVDKLGNMLTLTGTPSSNMIRVIGY